MSKEKQIESLADCLEKEYKRGYKDGVKDTEQRIFIFTVSEFDKVKPWMGEFE